MSHRSIGRAVLLGGLVSIALASCATGGGLPGDGGSGGTSTDTTTTSSSTTTTEPPKPGAVGSPCGSNADCMDGTCAPIGNASYCTRACPPACPTGSYCSIINGASICVPDLDQQCLKCAGTTDCKLPSDMCLEAPLGDSFCAHDCSVDGACPSGFTCVDKDSYAAQADAGAGDAGAGDAGTGDAGDAGAGDAGPGVPATAPYKWCVPSGGASCPCDDKRDGVVHACAVTNQHGTCVGAEACEGSSKSWKGCSAKTPKVEACNGEDDNCDGMIDEGDPNALCAAEGPEPPHATWACMAGECSLGACDPGWIGYPTSDTTTGCSCPIEVGEPNGSCATATPAGSVSDTGTPITISGTLSSATDVDVWTFDTVDVNEVTKNSYHVAISFVAPTPNTEFLIDVIQGATCSDAPTGPSTAITAYDWCVNGTNGATPAIGEASCGPTGPAHCANHSSKYFLRVYRKPGATGTCTQYQIRVSGGGGTCDVTKKCP
jgi:hypothetical protein